MFLYCWRLISNASCVVAKSNTTRYLSRQRYRTASGTPHDFTNILRLTRDDIRAIYTIYKTRIPPKENSRIHRPRREHLHPVPAHNSQHNHNRQDVRNNARLALPHNTHDGQHLFPACSSHHDDRFRRRHHAQLPAISMRGDTITYPRILHQVCLDTDN